MTTETRIKILKNRLPQWLEQADKDPHKKSFFDITVCMKDLSYGDYKVIFNLEGDNKLFYILGLRGCSIQNQYSKSYRHYFIVEKTKKWKYKTAIEYFGDFSENNFYYK